LKADLISPLDYEVLGEVKLQGFNGNICSGKIILLNVKLVGHNVYVPLRCVVCENVSQDCLLSLADYRKLEMWANAQRDGRPAEYRWRPLFNAAKFG